MALPSGTLYPGALDGITNGYGAVSGGDTIDASYANCQTSAVLSIETVIGVDPLSGTSYADIGDALAGKPDIGTIQTDELIVGADSGAANAYAITLYPTPPAYTAGQMVSFQAANSNTGASTLSVNGQTAQNLLKSGGDALESGDIVSGQMIQAVFDGTNFQLVGSPVTPSTIQMGSLVYSTDVGSTDAYAVVLTPTPAPYTAGQTVAFTAANSNDGPSTLVLNGQVPVNLVKAGGGSVQSGDILSGQAIAAIYDGTQFQLLGSQVTPSSIQSGGLLFAVDTGSSNAFQIALTPTPITYTAGQMVVFQSGQTNTGPATLSINGGTPQNLVLNGGTAFVGGEIITGQIVATVFDGAQFQMVGSASSSSGLGIPNTISELRLTLVSGTPISPDNASPGTTLYFTPFTGERIGLYDPTLGWIIWTTAELSFDASALDTSNPYDLFLYNDSGTLTLSALEWSSYNTRATDIVLQDGVYVQDGEPTYRYLGTFAFDTYDGNIYDDTSQRLVWNAQNRVPRAISLNADLYSTSSDTWSSVVYPDILLGLVVESVLLWGTTLGAGDGSSAYCEIGIGLGGSPDTNSATAATLGTSFLTSTLCELPPGIGLLTPTLYVRSTVNGHTVNLLDDGSGNRLTYLNGTMWG